MSDVLKASDWIRLTTAHNTPTWVRYLQIDSYGEVDPKSPGSGGSWISLTGSDGRYYVMQTVDQLHVLLGNNAP